jgi:dienelactone hydrolase
MRRFHPSIDELESRTLQTMVFIFNGNAYAEAKPDILHTQLAANLLAAHGDTPVQMTTPAMTSPAAFYGFANEIRAISKGKPIALMGFSAGGGLAMRLAGIAKLHVQAVLSYYGPPDLRDWLAYHHGDRYYKYVTGHVDFDPGIINILSGVSDSKSYIIDALGEHDHNVVASMSTASFDHDFPDEHLYYYDGPHGVSLYADYPAFEDFLSHL